MTVLDVFVDGAPLNTPVSGVDGFKGRRGLAGRRIVSVTAPGQHGLIPMIGAFDSYPFSLSVWVMAAPEGAVGTLAGLESNLDDLLGLFMKPGLIQVAWVAPDGSLRYGAARLMGSVEPEVDTTELFARFTVALELPGVWWRGAAPIVFSSPAFGEAQTVPLLATSTAPVVDAVFTVQGPAYSPTLSTPRGFVQFLGNLAIGQTITISNGGLWAKRNDGSSATSVLKYTGSNPRFLDLYPGDQVTCTCFGTDTNSRWSVSANPAYM